MSDDGNIEIFKRLNELENSYSEMKGMLAVMAKGYNRAILFLGILAIIGWLVVAYGAIGKEGMASIRQTLPAVPQGQPVGENDIALPPHNDLDKWRGAHGTHA